MRALLPVSLSIGILCGLWFQVTVWVPWLAAWVGYAAWASFYYAGGDTPAVQKSYIANLAGMVQGALFFWVWTQVGGGSMGLLSLIIGIYCFVMTIEGAFGLLATIPGQFVGAAVFFGNLAIHNGDIGSTLLHTAVCMLIGNVAGLISAKAPGWFQKAPAEADAKA